MALDRKAVRLALRDALKRRLANSVRSVHLRDQIIESLPETAFPALVLQVAGAASATDHVTPPVWSLAIDAALYVHPSPTDADPDALLDDLVTALEVALERQDGEDATSWWTTLGGICSRAFISGDVEYYGGGPRGMVKVVVPIEIVVPTFHPGR